MSYADGVSGPEMSFAGRRLAGSLVLMPHYTGPGADDTFDPWDLDDVRERIVVPVVASLIRPADLRRVDVGWGPHESIWGLGGFKSDDELWVLVSAADSTWQSQIWDVESAEQLETMGAVAWHLADRLEDWVCETVYWGEQAIADFVIPSKLL